MNQPKLVPSESSFLSHRRPPEDVLVTGIQPSFDFVVPREHQYTGTRFEFQGNSGDLYSCHSERLISMNLMFQMFENSVRWAKRPMLDHQRMRTARACSSHPCRSEALVGTIGLCWRILVIGVRALNKNKFRIQWPLKLTLTGGG